MSSPGSQKQGVRSAIVVKSYPGGFVLAGRSLQSVEERETSLEQYCYIGGLATLALTFISIFLTAGAGPPIASRMNKSACLARSCARDEQIPSVRVEHLLCGASMLNLALIREPALRAECSVEPDIAHQVVVGNADKLTAHLSAGLGARDKPDLGERQLPSRFGAHGCKGMRVFIVEHILRGE